MGSTVYSEEEFHIKMVPGDVGKYVILPGDPGRCESIAQYFDDPKLVQYNREYKTYTGYLDGVKVSVTSTGIGGPSASIAMEELHHIGADTFIRVGTCGGMALDVEGGHLAIASGAIRMEGTSKEYVPIEFPAVTDIEVCNALIQGAKKIQVPYHVGVVECKDSFYGQHEPEKKPVSYELLNKWDAWCKAGAIASEMESAALFVVSSYLRCRCGTVLAVCGNQERRKLNMPDTIVHDTTDAIRCAIEAIRVLIKQDREAGIIE